MILLLLAIQMCSTSCMKTTTCTCRDPGGVIKYNEINKTRSKQEKKHFENDCLAKESVYYTLGTGSTVATSTTVPCEIS